MDIYYVEEEWVIEASVHNVFLLTSIMSIHVYDFTENWAGALVAWIVGDRVF